VPNAIAKVTAQTDINILKWLDNRLLLPKAKIINWRGIPAGLIKKTP